MASRGVNKVILLGNLGQDPDCRTFQNGDMVANFSLATSETWQDKNTGEQREKTEWHRCVAYRGLAGVIQQYVKKGHKLYIEGRLQTRKWQDQNGQDRYTTEIVVDEMQMLTGRGSGGSASYDNGSSGGYNNNNSRQNNNRGYGNNSRGYGNNSRGGQNNYGNGGSQNYQNTPPAQPQGGQSYGPDDGMNGGGNFSDSDIPF